MADETDTALTIAEPMANPALSGSASLLRTIERLARDPSVDLDRMDRLFSLRDKMVSEEQRISFNAAMASVQAEVGMVRKNASNSQTRSRYADLAAIGAALDPVITKYGFALSFAQEADASAGVYKISCLVSHRDGFERKFEVNVPIDGEGLKGNSNKTPTHAFGSTVSYGRRYLTQMIFNIKTGDDDDGNAAYPRHSDPESRPVEAIVLINSDQALILRGLIIKTGTDTARFFSYFGIEGYADMPAKRFQEAVELLQKRLKAQEVAKAGKASTAPVEAPSAAPTITVNDKVVERYPDMDEAGSSDPWEE